MNTIFRNSDISFDRDMIQHIQGGLLTRVHEMHTDRESQSVLSNAMEGLSVTEAPSHLTPGLQPHRLQCLDSLALQVNQMGFQEQADLEAPSNPLYLQYLAERQEEESRRLQHCMEPCLQHCIVQCRAEQCTAGQGEAMDTAFLPSMASHCLSYKHTPSPNLHQEQQQLLYQQLGMVHQQQLEQQQRLVHSQQLAQQLGGAALPSRQPDLVPIITSMQLL